jgi:hypothetical protein
MRLTSVPQAIPPVLATTLAANAQPSQGVYVGAGTGYNITQAVRTTKRYHPPSDPTRCTWTKAAASPVSPAWATVSATGCGLRLKATFAVIGCNS